MPEIIGDVVIPSCLIIPVKEGGYVGTHEGEVFLSGNKIWFNVDGNAAKLITSA